MQINQIYIYIPSYAYMYVYLTLCVYDKHYKGLRLRKEKFPFFLVNRDAFRFPVNKHFGQH